jgi:purine-binding chemotaxis protein CheW
MKKEMTKKKQKAETQQNQGPLTLDIENKDNSAKLALNTEIDTAQNYLLERESTDYHPQCSDKCLEAVIEKCDKEETYFITGKELEEDIEKVQPDEKRPVKDVIKIEVVVFKVDEEEFALKISTIKEIIRVPVLTKIPDAPQYISGLCSLRGDLLPVIDSRKLFGMPDKDLAESSRIIVAEIHGKQVGLVSDKVSEVISVEENAIKEPPSSLKGIDGGVIKGILILENGKRVVMLLEAEELIKFGAFDGVTNPTHTTLDIVKGSERKEVEEEQIVIFNIGEGEYACNIDNVKEIIRLPEIMKVPDTAPYIEGVLSIRNQLMAVINLGKLLGMNFKQPDESSRVVIINNGNFSFGVIVDKVAHVIPVQKELFKKNSQIANCSYIKGIFNLNNGSRLIMMLDPHKLISIAETKSIMEVDHKKIVKDKSSDIDEADHNLEHIVVFKLGEEEYGIEINNVQEINRMCDITHFPGAPAFIAGMVNLRGDIIPLLNLRRLFAVPDTGSYNESQFIVVEFGRKKIGILIDSASEVLRFSKDYIEKAPELFKADSHDSYIDKIAKLNDGKRIVLILNLSTLLSFM